MEATVLPNVWTVEQFKKASSKAFSRRSSQLQAIDTALMKAQTYSPESEAGANAIIALLEAIAAWRKSKALQGKASGRARAVDELQSQLCAAAEAIYKRKIADANMRAPFIENKAIKQPHDPVAAKAAVQQGFQQMMRGTPKPPQSPKTPTPPVPVVTPPKRNATQDRLFDFLAQAMLDQRKKAMAYDDEDLFEDLDPTQQGRLAARWMLAVSNGVTDIPAARAEALRILAAMLGNDVQVIKNLLENNLEVVVVSRDEGMTVLQQFESIRGQRTFDGRSWDSVRGVGNVKNNDLGSKIREYKELSTMKKSGKGAASIVAIDPSKGRIYTAVTEENLLGGPTTAPGAGCYATGYSTTSHEFAHSVHAYGLTDTDRATIEKIYKMRLQQSETEEWVDGPRKVGAQSCYASMTVYEYFAQLSNAWLGVNFGNDPYTGKPRNNGKQWVLSHEPRAVSDIFERIYGNRALEDLNPAVILKS
jgi:hypothetical protein